MALAPIPLASEAGALDALATRIRPTVLAGERSLVVPGPLGSILPGGGLQRGSVTVVDGAPGSGATTVVLHLLAAATAAGEWAGLVDGGGVVGGLAVAEAEVALDRVGVVRRVPRAQWPVVVAALLEGTALVVAVVPRWARAGDARRLTARARERGAVLVAMGGWPAEAAIRITATGSRWNGRGAIGSLDARDVHVQVDARRLGGTRTDTLRYGHEAAVISGRSVSRTAGAGVGAPAVGGGGEMPPGQCTAGAGLRAVQ